MAKGIRKTNTKRSRRLKKGLQGLIPLSAEEIAARTSDKVENAPLDLLGRLKDGFAPSRRITVMEDSDLKLPELWLSVYVTGPEAGPNFNKMFARAKCFKADTPDDADVVVFSGSSHDIDPQLYGQKKHSSTFLNPAIDKANLILYAFCLKRGIPMVGVCGGAQLLHVANGGDLYQDVDGHNGAHTMWDVHGKMMLRKISSVHHQMCRRNKTIGKDGQPRMDVLGISHKSRERAVDDVYSDVGAHGDVEAFFYRDTCCLGFQGHPEYGGYSKYTQWCLESIDHHLNENPDLCYRANDSGSNKLRIKEDLLAERERDKAEVMNTPPSAELIIVEPKKG